MGHVIRIQYPSFDQVPEEIECWVADRLIRLTYLLTTDQLNKLLITHELFNSLLEITTPN